MERAANNMDLRVAKEGGIDGEAGNIASLAVASVAAAGNLGAVLPVRERDRSEAAQASEAGGRRSHVRGWDQLALTDRAVKDAGGGGVVWRFLADPSLLLPLLPMRSLLPPSA